MRLVSLECSLWAWLFLKSTWLLVSSSSRAWVELVAAIKQSKQRQRRQANKWPLIVSRELDSNMSTHLRRVQRAPLFSPTSSSSSSIQSGERCGRWKRSKRLKQRLELKWERSIVVSARNNKSKWTQSEKRRMLPATRLSTTSNHFASPLTLHKWLITRAEYRCYCCVCVQNQANWWASTSEMSSHTKSILFFYSFTFQQNRWILSTFSALNTQ